MSTEEKNIVDEETRLDAEMNQTGETTESPSVNNADSDKKNASNNWAKNAASGATGAAAGAVAGLAGSFLFSSFKEAEEPITDPDPQTQSQPSPAGAADFDGNQVPVAEGINDNMSFSQAFAAARHEVGAGGVFFWHGGVYGTYYSNEWNNLSPEYQRTFSNYPYQPSGEHHATDYQEHSGNQVNHDDVIAVDSDTDNIVLVDDTPEVEVLHAEIDGQSISYVPTYIDGQETVFIDVDNDGVYDGVIINDGTDNPPVYDLHEAGMHIGNAEIIELQDPQEPYLEDADLTDYTNDASIGTLV
jgi:hypothetical protein